MADTPTVFSDRYEMVRHIARGGMAQVYLAQDLSLDRPVALKVLFPELSVDRNFVERFRREAKAAANLSHPNIVSVFDWGQGESTYFIVMEFVDGSTLSSILRNGPMAPDRAAAVAASVAAALDFAHRRGVIHRDVKPGNVLIDRRNQVKVADFGIARAIGTSENLTQTGSVMGTATYFSPEQAQGYPVDPRSDVYSLGVVLYEMVAGKPPFSGDNPVAIAYKHVKEPAPLPRSVNPAIPMALESVILKAMAKDPADRYQSAEEMRADLARFSSGQAVTAPAAMAPTGVMGAVGGGAAATRVQTAVHRAPAPPAARSRAGWYALAALILAALLVGGYFLGRSAGVFDSTKSLKVPPGLVNQQVSVDQNLLSAYGFTNVRTTQVANPAAAGTVISTDPASGTTIRSSALLTLTVSSGPVQVPVPNEVGQQKAAADAALSALHFTTNDTSQYSTQPVGVVLSTDPAAGTNAPQGSVVQVVYSGGPQQVQVPSVYKQDQATAGATLEKAGLQIGGTQTEPSSSVQSGLVIGTNPPNGATVPANSAVTLFVSSGPPPTTTTATTQVPNLNHDTEQQAQDALTAVGLNAAFNTVTVNDKHQDGLVQNQSPSPGQNVPVGSTVQVYVGQYQSGNPTTTTPPGQ